VEAPFWISLVRVLRIGATMLRESPQAFALGAIASGIVIASGLYYVWPDFYWWIYPLIGLGVVGAAYQPWVDMLAEEDLVDRRLMRK